MTDMDQISWERERERERERGYAYVYVYIQCVILELIILFSYYRIINSWYKKPVLNLYFRFEFFVRKLDNSLCTSLIVSPVRLSGGDI